MRKPSKQTAISLGFMESSFVYGLLYLSYQYTW
jgi:hypothetical protein